MKQAGQILKDLLRQALNETDLGNCATLLIATARRSQITSHELLQEVERRYLTMVLTEVGGNQCQAAHDLGMHRNTLSRRIELLGIDPRACKRPPAKDQIRAKSEMRA